MKERYMAQSVELEAKTIEKAIEQACQQFSIDRDTLEYKIISYGSSGIFGLGRTKNARIRVFLPADTIVSNDETAAELPDDQKDNDGVKRTVKTLIAETGEEQPAYSLPEEPIELGKHILTRIVNAITSDADILVKEDRDRVIFNIEGGNAAVLIGKHGQTLEAMQALVEKIVNKHHSERIRIEVDVESYLKNRKNNLQRQAAKMAEKCRRIRRPVTLGYMNAHDRRIVHLALKNHDDVRTQSHGDGFLRKLMIFPKRSQHQPKRQNG
jgi:spoIIIJ-associated protein